MDTDNEFEFFKGKVIIATLKTGGFVIGDLKSYDNTFIFIANKRGDVQAINKQNILGLTLARREN
jgi:hypothetical protein